MLFIPGAASHPRFRVPIEPFMSIIIAYAILNVWNLFQIKRERKNN
jgi:hypothetical protein